jgi:hypothetical protein
VIGKYGTEDGAHERVGVGDEHALADKDLICH